MAVSLAANALCSLDDVKSHLRGGNTGTTYDPLLTRLINGFSAAAEGYCGREFAYRARTGELFDAYAIYSRRGPTTEVFVKAPPIDATAALTVWDDPTRTFTAPVLALTENTDYVVNRTLGIITKISPVFTEVGFSTWNSSEFQFELDRPHFGFGYQSVRIDYTGGLVVPRTAAPAAPSLSTSATGLTGTYQYKISTVISGNESTASALAAITLDDQKAVLTFANPGASKTTNIYRTLAIKKNEAIYGLLTSVAGSGAGGNQTHTDYADDNTLDLTSKPPDGPLSLPDDLREAAIQAVAEQYNRSNSGDVVSIKSAPDVGSVTWGNRSVKFSPYVQSILDYYRLVH